MATGGCPVQSHERYLKDILHLNKYYTNDFDQSHERWFQVQKYLKDILQINKQLDVEK